MMAGEKAAPETDKEPNTRHPRETYAYIGHDDEEAALAEALRGGRMHHAWMVTGPKGLGKATLAYRFARVALGAHVNGARPLQVDPEDPIARKIAAQSHPDLFILRRGLNERGRPRREISVDEARELGQFFSLAPSQGGMRIAIIDAVDDMNRNAANAILKTLEEPPARSAIILVCSAPGALLPTIRSRCRRLPLRTLSDQDMRKAVGGDVNDTIVRLARGRPGRAIAWHAQGGDAVSAKIAHAAEHIARGEGRALLQDLYDQLSGEPFEKLSAVLELAEEWVRAAGVEQGADNWAEAWSALEQLRIEAEDLDMDARHALARAVGIVERAANVRR